MLEMIVQLKVHKNHIVTDLMNKII